MRRLCNHIVLILTLIVTYSVEAQDNVLMKKINSLGPVQMKYDLQVDNADGKGITSQSGTLYYQNGLYRLDSKELQIICDGKSRWIYNKSSEEVVVSKNDYHSSSPVDNPLLLLADSNVKDNGDGTFRVIYNDKNGYHYIVKISSLKKSENHQTSFFVLEESQLSDDVIITDLR